MTTRVGAVVEVNADTEEAQRDIRRFGRTVEDAAADLDRLGDEGREMGRKVEQGFDNATDGAREYSRASRAAEAAQQKFNDSLREFALGFVTIQGAMMLARSAAAGVASAFRTLAEASEETARRQAEMARQTERLSLALAETAIGGEQADLIFARLAVTSGRLAADLEESGDGAGFLGERLGGAVVAMDGLIQAMQAIGGASDAVSSGFGLLSDDAANTVQRVMNLAQAFNGPIGFTVAVSEGLEILNEMGSTLEETDAALAQLASTSGIAGSWVSDFFDRVGGGALRAVPALDRLIQRIEAVTGVDLLDLDAGELDAPAPTMRCPDPAAIESSAIEAVEAAGAGYLGAADSVLRSLGDTVSRFMDERIATLEARADEANARTRAKMEAEVEYASEMQALEAERALANSEKIKAAYDARVAAAQDYATAVGSVVQQVAGGQAKALDAIKALIGQELIAKGQARLLEAAALFFVPGQQVAAVGLTAAAGAMIAAGAALSKSGASGGGGSAVGAGVAPAPAVAQSVQRTDVTVISNFGVVGDPREAARVVADSVRTATREGYL